jgi:hypothetical protein
VVRCAYKRHPNRPETNPCPFSTIMSLGGAARSPAIPISPSRDLVSSGPNATAVEPARTGRTRWRVVVGLAYLSVFLVAKFWQGQVNKHVPEPYLVSELGTRLIDVYFHTHTHSLGRGIPHSPGSAILQWRPNLGSQDNHPPWTVRSWFFISLSLIILIILGIGFPSSSSGSTLLQAAPHQVCAVLAGWHCCSFFKMPDPVGLALDRDLPVGSHSPLMNPEVLFRHLLFIPRSISACFLRFSSFLVFTIQMLYPPGSSLAPITTSRINLTTVPHF